MSMFEDDDFFINDDELAEDNQETIIDISKTKLLDSLIKSANDMKGNLKFNEQSEAGSNLRMITSYVDSLLKLEQLDAEQFSDEEIEEEIDKILKSTTELTFGNINEVLPDEPEETKMISDDTSEGNEGTDW